MSIPRNIFLDTNINCNLKCVQCDIHMLRNPAGELTLEERMDVIREIGEWDSSIRVLFSGGEPLLRRNDIYTLAGLAAQYGIHTSINTNGTILKEEDIEQLPHSGLRAIVFSIDSHVPEVHDRIRGVPGTFQKVTHAVKQMAKVVKSTRAKCSILINTILGAHNCEHIPALFDLTEELGADAIIFQPIQPNFERKVEPNWWIGNEFWPQNEQLIHNSIDTLLEMKAQRRKTFQTPLQFEDMRAYFLHPGKTVTGQCTSMRENLMIDMMGEVKLCFNMDRLGLGAVGNVRDESLLSIWEQSRSTSNQMTGCSLECGAMLCHAR